MYMPYLKNREDSPHPEEEFLALHEATYMMTDDYIGEFLPMIDEGWTILVFSDHSLLCREHDNQYICDNYGINVGIMSELGYLVMKTDEQGNMIPEIDWEHTGFFNYTRSDFEKDTREEVLATLARHFML